ncbi:hypothetical protein Pmani_023236 [Petrolisthes manimaculis]|uniref:DET1 homolog n=1 Tax=Petrolisthes manimaculis TaxID=1843537 RepID=A0AAE1U0E2_9EUCA|nr:hypothetical protein Pmani_023236 [Petrolisthes manimaculis]
MRVEMESDPGIPVHRIPPQNLVVRLFHREIHKQSHSQLHTDRCFYHNVTPNFTVTNVQKPPCFLRKFSPDGRFLIAFSSDQTSIEIFRYMGPSAAADILHWCESGNILEENDPRTHEVRRNIFDRFFRLKHTVKVASNQEQLNRECSLFTDDGKYVIVGSAASPDDAQNLDHFDMYRNNESVTPNPRSPLEDYTLHIVDMEMGRLCDSRTFRHDKIYLSHNQGLYLYRHTLAVLSVQHQTIYIFQITGEGYLLEVRTIGRVCYEDDDYFLASVCAEPRPPHHGREKTINCLKHRALPVPCEILRKEIEDINRQGDEQTPEEIAQTVDIEAALRAEAAATPQEAMQVDNDYRMSDLSAVLALGEALKTKVLEIETTQLCLTHNLLNPNLLNSNLLNPNLALPMNPNLALPMNPNLALPMNPNLAHPMNPNLALQVNPNLAPLQVQAPQVTLLLVFLYRCAVVASQEEGTPRALREFFHYFDHLHRLRMWKMQLLDDLHLLIKYASEEVVTLRAAEPNGQPSFFMVYNMVTTEVLAVYENTSLELLHLFEKMADFFRNARLTCESQFTCSPSNNTWARLIHKRFKKTFINARGGGVTEATKRLLGQLPISAQSFSASPYLDLTLFSYDDKWVSVMERPKSCADHPIRFYGRNSGLIKFSINAGRAELPGSTTVLPPARRLVAFTFHPADPFTISVQRANADYVVNFHLRHQPS